MECGRVPPPQSPSKNSHELIAGDDMCCPGQSLDGRPTGDAGDAIFSSNTCTMAPSEVHPAAVITQPWEHQQSTDSPSTPGGFVQSMLKWQQTSKHMLVRTSPWTARSWMRHGQPWISVGLSILDG